MADFAAFDEELALEIVETHNALLASGLLDRIRKEGLPSQSVTNANAPIYFRNDSGATIPSYGLIQMVSTVEDTGNFITVKQPIDSTLLRSPLLINGPYEVAANGFGVAQPGPVYRLLHDGGTYVAGDRLGAKTGTFTATYGALYSVIGADAIDTNIVRVMFDTSAFYGKTKAGGLTAATPANVYFVDAAGTVTSREYLAETKVSNIAGDTLIALIPMYGRLFASEIC